MANGLEHKLLRTYINLLQTNMIAYTLCKPLLRPWLISRGSVFYTEDVPVRVCVC